MSTTAQQTKNFPAGRIGDCPEDSFMLLAAICNHVVTVTIWLQIVNADWQVTLLCHQLSSAATPLMGRVSDVSVKVGQSLFEPAVRHLPDNVGNKPFELLVELKSK